MLKHIIASAAMLSCLALAGCGLFDSGTEWRSGPYALLWIDTSENVSLSFSLSDNTWVERIEPQVFAVGENEHYLVAKQHPNGDKKIVNYFVVLRGVDSASADVKQVVVGPLTAKEFEHKTKELNLPPFTTVLEKLQ